MAVRLPSFSVSQHHTADAVKLWNITLHALILYVDVLGTFGSQGREMPKALEHQLTCRMLGQSMCGYEFTSSCLASSRG